MWSGRVALVRFPLADPFQWPCRNLAENQNESKWIHCKCLKVYLSQHLFPDGQHIRVCHKGVRRSREAMFQSLEANGSFSGCSIQKIAEYNIYKLYNVGSWLVWGPPPPQTNLVYWIIRSFFPPPPQHFVWIVNLSKDFTWNQFTFNWFSILVPNYFQFAFNLLSIYFQLISIYFQLISIYFRLILISFQLIAIYFQLISIYFQLISILVPNYFQFTFNWFQFTFNWFQF